MPTCDRYNVEWGHIQLICILVWIFWVINESFVWSVWTFPPFIMLIISIFLYSIYIRYSTVTFIFLLGDENHLFFSCSLLHTKNTCVFSITIRITFKLIFILVTKSHVFSFDEFLSLLAGINNQDIMLWMQKHPHWFIPFCWIMIHILEWMSEFF